MPSAKKPKPTVQKFAFALAPAVGDRYPVGANVRLLATRDDFYESLVERISLPRLWGRSRPIGEVLEVVERAANTRHAMWEAVYERHPQLRGCSLGLRNSGAEVVVLALPSQPKKD